MENSREENLANKKEINIETADGCLELLRNSVTLFREVYQIRDELGFSKHRSRMVNADVDGYRTFRDNYLKLKNHIRGVISHNKEGNEVTDQDVKRAQILYNRLIKYRDRVVDFAESKGIEFVDEEVTDDELKTMEEEELPKSAVNDRLLKKMAEHTFLPEEVGTKDDFERNVRGRLIEVMVAAGETPESANHRLTQSLDKVSYGDKSEEEVVAEVNRIIHNIYSDLQKKVESPITESAVEAEGVVPENIGVKDSDTSKEEIESVFNFSGIKDKVSQLEKMAHDAQFDLSEKNEYLQLKELVKKIEILDGRVSNGGLDWEPDKGIRAIRLKKTNEQITSLQAQADGFFQILNKEINQKSESFRGYFGDEMAELRDSMSGYDDDFSKSEPQVNGDKKTGWWDKDFQKSHSVDQGTENKTPESVDEGDLSDKGTGEGEEVPPIITGSNNTGPLVLTPEMRVDAPKDELPDEGQDGVTIDWQDVTKRVPFPGEKVRPERIDAKSSPETGNIDVDKLKNNYEASGKRLEAINKERIELYKALVIAEAKLPGEAGVRERKAVWDKMDLKDVEYMKEKRYHLRNHKELENGLRSSGTPIPDVRLVFMRHENELRTALLTETTKKRFGLLRKILGPSSALVGAMFATSLGDGELSRDGGNFFDASKLSSTRMAVGQALADSGKEGLTIKTQKDVEINRQEASKLDPSVLPDGVPEVSVPTESAVPLTDSPEIIPEVPFSEPEVQDGIDSNNIFSREALQFGHNPGVELKYPENIGQENLEAIEKTESNRFRVEVPRDVYWNIMEGQTAAGDLPFLSKIKQENKQALIDLVRDRIDADAELRAELGFGKESADQTYIGDEINIELLNKIAEEVAAQNNYLLPGVTLGATAGETGAISPSEIAPIEKMQFDTPNADDGEYKSVAESSAVIVTDSVAEQFKNNFVGGEQAYNRSFNSWVQAIEGFTDGEGGWFSNLFGGVHKSAFAVLRKMTIAEVEVMTKLSARDLRTELQPLGLPIAEVRAWLEKIKVWINSEQLTGVRSTDEFSKLANKAFVLEKLTPSLDGDKK